MLSFFNNIYLKGIEGKVVKNNPSQYLLDYMAAQGVILPPDCIVPESATIKEQQSDDIIFDE